MALPPLPGGGIPERPRPASSALPSLPNLAAPREPQISPALAPFVAQFEKKFGRKPNAVELERIQIAVEQRAAKMGAPVPPALPPQQKGESKPIAQETLDEKWAVDPKTGKKYKKIPGFVAGVMSSKGNIQRIANGGASLDQLRTMVELDPDFKVDDLNGSAELFMAHLRVPPDKEEQKRLAEERKALQKMYDEIAAKQAAEEEKEYSDD